MSDAPTPLRRVWPFAAIAIIAALTWAYVDLRLEVQELRLRLEFLEREQPQPEPTDTAEDETAEDESAGAAPAAHASVTTGPGLQEDPATWRCEGAVAAEEVQRVVGRQGRGVFDCYRQLLERSPEQRGNLVLTLEVGAEGRARRVNVRSSFDDALLTRCVGDLALEWELPTPDGGDCAVVEVPFSLTPEAVAN